MELKELNKEELTEQIAYHYKEILKLIGEDPQREGLIKTPRRAAKAILDITSGYHMDPMAIAKQAVFEHAGSRMIVVKDIEFYSMCEHHILPFFGKIAIGYIPNDKMIGLSKLGRLVDVFARRLQVQERLTSELCNILTESLPNKGVMVACDAQHLCMKMRGVEKQDSSTLTMDYTGDFIENQNLRNEFMRLAGL